MGGNSSIGGAASEYQIKIARFRNHEPKQDIRTLQMMENL